MLEAAILSAQDTYSVSDGHMTPAMSGSGLGLAAFDKRGELSRTDGFRAMPGGFLGLKGLGPHSQEGDVDFQVQLEEASFLHLSLIQHGVMMTLEKSCTSSSYQQAKRDSPPIRFRRR